MTTIYMSRLKINSRDKQGKLSSFLLGQRLIPETGHDNYLNDQLNKFQINTWNKKGQLSVDEWL